MSESAFYVLGGLVVIFLCGFVGFYVYRLTTVRRRADDGVERRLHQMMRAESATASQPAAPAEGAPGPGPAAPATPLVYERGPGLRKFTEEAVFMKRDRAGEISFQLGEKRPMPLKFLLDPHGRKVLSDLSMRATVDFGKTWAILAEEDEEGRLKVTRLA